MAIHIDVLSRLDESSAEEVGRQLERTMERSGERAAGAFQNAFRNVMLRTFADDAERAMNMDAALDKITAKAEIAGKAIGAALVGGITAAAVGLVAVAEQFEAINRGLMTATTAAGQQLTELNDQAKRLAGTMDVAAGGIGNLMGQISSQMGATGPVLEQLTYHIGELGERFKGLSTDALIGGLVQMHVPAEQADQVIASLVQSAREFGGVMPQIAQGLAQYGSYFTDLKLNAEQAGHMIGELAKAHIPLQTAMGGLQAAQKANVDVAKNTGQPVQDFAAFVKRAADTMEDANNRGNTALRDQIALLVFGQRKWIDAEVAARTYLDTVRQGPEAFHGSIEEENKFIEATANLHNEFQRLKNQIALALEPVAHDWVDTLVNKLKEFGDWAREHQSDLRNLFEGAATVAGAVLEVLEKIAEVLGSHPALIEAVLAAFMTWKAATIIWDIIGALQTIGTLLAGLPAIAAEAGTGIAAGLAPALAAATGIAAAFLAAKQAMDYFSGGAAGNQANQTPQDQRSWWDTLKTWMSGDVERDEQGRPKYGPGSANQPPSVPFFDAQGRPLNAQGQPFGGYQGPPNPTPYVPGTPTATPSQAPAAPGVPQGPMVVDPDTGALLTPEDFEKQKQTKGRKPKLPEAPEVPFPAGYGGPPGVGETEQHYRDRMALMEKQHQLATDQARVDQLEKSNVATADEIQKAKNKVLEDQVHVNEAEAALNKSESTRLKKHSSELEEIGAKIDQDFGISKGLPGIAENLTKFLFNLAFAPALGAMEGVKTGLGYPGKTAGSGLAGIIGSALGMAGPPGGAQGGGAGGEVWTGAGWAPSAGGAGGGFGMPSLTYPGSISTPADLSLAGQRVSGLYQFANSLVGTPYSTQLRNDCSGMVSELANVALGLPPSRTSFDTTSEGAWLQQHGFQSGIGPPGSFQVGWNPQPGMSGHTAATLPGGVHAEQGGSHNVFVLGPGAAGGESSQFPLHAYLPMIGGTANTAGYPTPTVAESAIRAGVVPQYPGIAPPPSRASGGEVPIIAHSGEHVLTAGDVSAMGGQGAVYAFRAGLHYDIGGGVPPPAAPPPPPPPEPPLPTVPTPPGMITTRQLPHMPAQGPGITIPGGDKGANAPKGPPGANAPEGPAGPNAPQGPPAQAPTPQAPTGGPVVGPEPIGGGEPMALPGPGIGIGGGLIGLAESAPGMAASTMGAPFGGAMASAAMQIGIQELNRAIGFAGQAAGIGVQGLMETFLPAGVSKLASDNWITRIAAGVSGAKPQLPNVAGEGEKQGELSKGLTAEQLAALPGQQAGQQAGTQAANNPAAPLIHIDNFHSLPSANATASALNDHLVAASPVQPGAR